MAQTTTTHYEEAGPGGVSVGLIAMVGLISVMLFVVLVFATEAWFYDQQRQMDESNYRRGNPAMDAYMADQNGRLGRVGKIQGLDTHVMIPVERAIEIYAKKQVGR